MAEASAPASSANLGAGFDTVALALDIRCRVAAQPAEDWRVEHMGENHPGPSSADAVLMAAQQAVGIDHPLHLTVNSAIPLARGLGSSAAASAAGATAAWRARGVEPSPEEVFRLVADLEGHADNAAAAVFGGLQAVTFDGQAHPLTLHPNLLPVVAVPDAALFTSDARAALPVSFPRELVVRSLQRMMALVEGLRIGDPRLLAAAAGDEIHERPRTDLNPLAGELIESARAAGASFACWSGAGPAVLALVPQPLRSAVAETLGKALGGRGLVLTPAIATTGLD